MSVLYFKVAAERDKKSKQLASSKAKSIGLDTVFNILKHGEDIGLNVENNDSLDNMHRILELDNVRLELIEWRVLSIWTVKIEIFNEDKNLVVYKSPYLDINWRKESINWAEKSDHGKPLDVQWIEKGEWCTYITDKINAIAIKLEEKHRADLLKKEDKENLKNQETDKMRTYFNGLFKSKNQLSN